MNVQAISCRVHGIVSVRERAHDGHLLASVWSPWLVRTHIPVDSFCISRHIHRHRFHDLQVRQLAIQSQRQRHCEMPHLLGGSQEARRKRHSSPVFASLCSDCAQTQISMPEQVYFSQQSKHHVDLALQQSSTEFPQNLLISEASAPINPQFELADAIGPPQSVADAIRMAMQNSLAEEGDEDAGQDEELLSGARGRRGFLKQSPQIESDPAEEILARARNPYRERAAELESRIQDSQDSSSSPSMGADPLVDGDSLPVEDASSGFFRLFPLPLPVPEPVIEAVEKLPPKEEARKEASVESVMRQALLNSMQGDSDDSKSSQQGTNPKSEATQEGKPPAFAFPFFGAGEKPDVGSSASGESGSGTGGLFPSLPSPPELPKIPDLPPLPEVKLPSLPELPSSFSLPSPEPSSSLLPSLPRIPNPFASPEDSSSPLTKSLKQLGQKLDQEFPAAKTGDAIENVAGTVEWFLAQPGILGGALDLLLLEPLQLLGDFVTGKNRLRRQDFVLGRRLGEGNFGTVYEGAIRRRGWGSDDEGEEVRGRRTRRLEEMEEDEIQKRVVLKKIKTRVAGGVESGDMEEWFNRRMQRAAADVPAVYMGSFIADITRGNFTEGGKWLVWDYESDTTLSDYMQESSFPSNLESAVFGTGQVLLAALPPLARQGAVVKQLLRQILLSLSKMHATGIVHRDIKPANLLVTNTGRVKVIDFGAAVDLRIGKNFEPGLALFDPDYCPPEQLVLPEETPAAPPAPLAALLAPALWQWQHPDLFDTYAVGVIFLQMACPTLRASPSALMAFRQDLALAGYDLQRWRDGTRMRPDLRLLDMDGGLGFDLAAKLVCRRGGVLKGRLSANEALRHPYLLLGVDQAATAISKLTLSR